jgi:hypothetical protein
MPVISPVDAFRLRPSGRGGSTDQVTGARPPEVLQLVL